MNTEVLIVGAGPTGLMLANQLARRGVRVLIIDRHPGPSLQTRALGVQARTLEIYAKLGIADRAIELGKRGHGANMWSEGRQVGHVSFGDAGAADDCVSLHPHPRAGRQRTHHGREAARVGRRGPMEYRAAGSGAARLTRRGDAQISGWRNPHDHCRLRRGLRRRAQLRAHAERHRFSRRALRACVLRRRRHGDRPHDCGRSERLPVARGIPSVHSDARHESLAHGRHRAAAAARAAGSGPRRCRSVAARRGRGEPVDRSVLLVLDLPDSSSRGRPLPRSTLLSAGRRRARAQSRRRTRHEYRLAGRLQPRVEARTGRAGQSRCLSARLVRSRASAGRAAVARHDRSRIPPGRLGQPVGRAAADAGSCAHHGVRGESAGRAEGRIPHRLADGNSTIAAARCRVQSARCRSRRRRPAIGFPG